MKYFNNFLAFKLKFFYALLLFAFCVPNIQAQQAVNTSGGNATGSDGTSSYSVGQVAYTNATGSGGTITQGVQQPFEIVTLGTDNFPQITLQMVVYPNPTTSFINLKIDDFDFQKLEYQLFDIQGREIAKQKISNQETQIEMANLPQAIYFLKITDENKLLKTFKISKN